MRQFVVVPVLVMSLMVAPAALAAGKKPTTRPAGGNRTIQGMVQSVEKNTLTISILKKKGELKEHKVRVRKGTVVTLNGSPVALADLKAGENVTVHLTHGAAKDIAATSK